MNSPSRWSEKGAMWMCGMRNVSRWLALGLVLALALPLTGVPGRLRQVGGRGLGQKAPRAGSRAQADGGSGRAGGDHDRG